MKIKLIYVLLSIYLINNTTAQGTASEQVTKLNVAAPQLDTLKTIWVYLPREYKNTELRFPVIYMHDAQNLFDAETSYVDEWEVDEYMDTLTNNKSIIIGIEHGNEKRIDELTPFKHEKYGGGKGESYISFIKNTLKPKVDSIYRTKPEAKHTTIFGSSLGGLISFYSVIKYPETFSKAGIFSPSFWINPEIYDFVKTSDIPETSKFYFLAGTDEGETMIPKLEEMITLLNSKGVKETQYEKHIVEDGKHNEQLWASHFGNAYQYLTTND